MGPIKIKSHVSHYGSSAPVVLAMFFLPIPITFHRQNIIILFVLILKLNYYQILKHIDDHKAFLFIVESKIEAEILKFESKEKKNRKTRN